MEREREDPVALPPIPSSYLVLHKLKQWDECRTHAQNNPGSDDQSAHLILVRKELFTMLRTLRLSIPKFHHDPTYDPNLHNESAPRIDRFMAAHHCYAKEWRKMGLGPSEGLSQPSERLVRPKRREYGIMQIRWLAAQTTVAILAELGLPCAIFGSMACKLYGNHRVPNDIDILVLPPPERASITQEEIKALIAQHASPNYHFILKPARNPSATYKVLHFIARPRPSTDVISHDSMSLQNHDTTNDDATNNDDSISQEFTIPVSIPRHSSSKVDILLPGVMHLPALRPSMITQLSSLPLVPFPVLLLQKLQGWADHSVATEARYRRKIGVDSRDLEWCLNWRTVNRHLLKYVRQREYLKKLWGDRTMFSEEFEALSRARVREFCEVYTGLREAWRAIGFDV